MEPTPLETTRRTSELQNTWASSPQAPPSETAGVEEVADGVWAVLFYGTELGRFDERDDQFET